MPNKVEPTRREFTEPVIPMTPEISPEQITEYIKAALQTNRISFLNVGMLLDVVRRGKLYAALGHRDLESYAREHLKLGHTSLYNYLRVYDWVAKTHPEWLDPEPGTFIPDLYDTVDLIWIEKELTKKDLSADTLAGLEKLKEKALAGELERTDLKEFRGHATQTEEAALKNFLAKMRALRDEGATLPDVPSEIISGLDNIIEMLQHTLNLPLRVMEGGGESRMAGVG